MKIIALLSVIFVVGCSTNRINSFEENKQTTKRNNSSSTYFITSLKPYENTYTNHYEDVKLCMLDSITLKIPIDTSTFFSLNERRVIYRNVGSLQIYESSKHVIKTCVTRKGDVAYVSILESNSKSKELLEKILKAASGYKFMPDEDAPCVECGKLTIQLNITGFRK